MLLARVSEHSKGSCKCIRVPDLLLCKVSGREASVCCHMHVSASSVQAQSSNIMKIARWILHPVVELGRGRGGARGGGGLYKDDDDVPVTVDDAAEEDPVDDLT